MCKVAVVRKAPIVVAGTGVFVAGAAEVDITPNPGSPMAGYSTEGQFGNGAFGRLFARALYLRDASGSAVAFAFIDMMSASRYLLEKTASITAESCGISVDRLLLSGTHTHTGPGAFYGYSLYDTFAQLRRGFDRRFSDWVSGRIAAAVAQAKAAAVPATVGVGVSRLWGVSRNRSYAAYVMNGPPDAWNAPGMPGASPDPGLTAAQRAVDPRLTALAAFRVSDGKPIASFATFSCHGTAMGTKAEHYHPDWWGYAVRGARRALETAPGGGTAVVAMAPSAAGDVNALRPEGAGLPNPMTAGPELAAWVGERAVSKVVEATAAARAAAGTPSIDARYFEAPQHPRDASVPPDMLLADQWSFGAPTLGGSEESRTIFYKTGLAKEGMTGDFFPASDPQHPKVQGLGEVQNILRKLLDLETSPVLPLHVIRIGDHAFATVPGEPTTRAAHRIETDVAAALGPAARVTVIGYAGDFGGYYTTKPEYEAQHYEGGSTLYGRNASAHLAWRLKSLASEATPPGPPPVTTIAFVPGGKARRFHAHDSCPGTVNPRPHISRNGRRVRVSWRMPLGCRIAFFTGPFIQVVDGGGAPYTAPGDGGRPFDDVTQMVRVQREKSDGIFPWFERFLGRIGFREDWFAELDLPPAAPPGLSLVASPRHHWAGFTASIPPG